jgi:hypothetical protein
MTSPTPARRRRAPVAALLCVAVAAGVLSRPGPAHAYDFWVNAQTIGQAYQQRAGDGSLLDRRRLTQYVRLGIFGLLDKTAGIPLRRGSPDDSPSIGFVGSFRFDSDFGIDSNARILTPQLDQYYLAFSLLYAYFFGRNFLKGWLEWEVGRQFIIDQLDWYAFDGANVRFVLKPLFVSVEGFAGVQVEDNDALGTNVWMLDGTAVTPLDPFSQQHNAVSPMAGFAVMAHGLRWLQTRFAYRRTWSATQNQDLYFDPAFARAAIGTLPPGASLGSGVEEEKIAYSATIFPYFPKYTIRLTGGFRYNLLLSQFDDIRASADFQLTPRHSIGGEYYRIRPDFIGDSIFNVFSTQATEDAHLRYSFKLTPYWEIAARGTARFYEYLYPPASPMDPAGRQVYEFGGSLGARYWNKLRYLRGEFNWVQGYGGRRGGIDVAGRYPFLNDRIRVDGRLTWVTWEDDLRNPAPPETQSFDAVGHSFGVQVGGTWIAYKGVLVHVLLEENINQIYASQFRIVAMLDLSLWR